MSEQESDPPGAVSDQNSEEQQSGLREDGQHPEPRARDEDEGGAGASKGDGDGDSSGASGEGSQSTGNPDSAG